MQLLGHIKQFSDITLLYTYTILNTLNVAMQYVRGDMLSDCLSDWPEIHAKFWKMSDILPLS